MFEKGDRSEMGNGNILEEVNLFNVHCTHYRIITMKFPHIINV
jgi:hypothetical protein